MGKPMTTKISAKNQTIKARCIPKIYVPLTSNHPPLHGAEIAPPLKLGEMGDTLNQRLWSFFLHRFWSAPEAQHPVHQKPTP